MDHKRYIVVAAHNLVRDPKIAERVRADKYHSVRALGAIWDWISSLTPDARTELCQSAWVRSAIFESCTRLGRNDYSQWNQLF